MARALLTIAMLASLSAPVMANDALFEIMRNRSVQQESRAAMQRNDLRRKIDSLEQQRDFQRHADRLSIERRLLVPLPTERPVRVR